VRAEKGAERTRRQLSVERTPTAVDAYAQCFLGKVGGAAARTLMSELAAGDEVLSDPGTRTRVVVNQHKMDDGKVSDLLTIKHGRGLLELTPDHILELDGKLVPARVASVGATLSNGAAIEAIALGRGGIINPLTSTGKILAAAAAGEPVVAATGNEWTADIMLSAFPQYTLSYALAAAFPASVQTYYDAALEPLFTAAVPRLAKLKTAVPAPLVGVGLVAGDAALAAGLAAYSLGLKGAATLAAASLVAARAARRSLK